MLAVYALRMQLNKIRLVPVCLALSTVWSLAGQSTTTRVAVVVTDQEGAVVAHAQVRFAGGPNPFGETATDNLGQLTVELTPGSYTLSVSNQVFERYTRQVEVLPVKEEQIFPVVLKVLDLGGVMVSTAGLELISKNHAQVVFEPSDIKTLQHIPVIAHNPHTDADETYSGVRLADLLAKIGAPLGSALHGKALANYIVATGSDGYQAVLALGEVDPSFHPGEVIVADTMNGKPLDAHSGPFKLVVTEDKRPARSVRNLVSIELKSAQ